MATGKLRQLPHCQAHGGLATARLKRPAAIPSEIGSETLVLDELGEILDEVVMHAREHGIAVVQHRIRAGNRIRGTV